METNQVESIELKGADGRIYNLISAPLKNIDGKVDKVAEIILDVTDQKESENKVKESEEKYRQLFEENINGIILIDLNGYIIDWNSSIEKNFGYRRDNYIGKSVVEFPGIDSEFIFKIKERLKKYILGEKLDPKRIKVYKKDGTPAWVNTQASLVDVGKEKNLQIIIEDITDIVHADQKLKESEEKFRNIAEQTHMGITIMQDDVIKYLNQRMADLYGYSAGEVNNWKPGEFTKLFAPDSLEMVMDQAKKKQSGESGQISKYTIHCVKKSGVTFWVENISKTILYKGRPADLSTQIDITERIKAEQQIVESEEKYRTLFEGANDAIFLIKDYKFFECNTKTLEVFGAKTEADIIGLFPWNLSPPSQPDGRDSKQAAIDYMNDALNGSSQRFNWKHQKMDGTLIDTGVYLNRILLENKYYLQAVVRNITEKLKSEQKLKDSEEKYRMLFNEIPMAVFLFDDEGNFIEGNTNQKNSITGYSTNLSTDKNFSEIIQLFKNYEEIAPLFKKRDEDRKLGKKLEPVEFKVVRQDGKERWINWQTTQINLKKKKLIQAIAQDITKRKEAEQLIIEENKKLQELSDLRQELITRISHELKTPITSTYGASQALLELHKKEMNNQILEFVEIIQRGSKRLKFLVENLLDIIKLESKVFKIEFKEENLIDIIRENVYDLMYFAKIREINVNLTLPDKLFLHVDKLRIGQVITNIVSNAINNTPPGGNIIISINKANDHVDIIIKDTGVGITEQEKLRLFQKFGKIERFGQGSDVYIEGSGLGLFISKQFVELHGGEIFVESEGRNKGAIFTVRLYRKERKD